MITRTGQSGISIEGTRITVTNNELHDVGGGGTPGFTVNATDCQIVNNTYTYSGNGPADGRIVVSANSNNNTFKNNRGFQMVGNIR